MSSHDLTSHTADYDIVRKMRASILVLGPMLARDGQAVVSLPGGCAIGARPVDLHLHGAGGAGRARWSCKDGYVHARAPGGLKGGRIDFPFVSVGRHRERADGGDAGEGHDGNRQRRARARDRRSGRCLREDGRADRGRRDRHDHRAGGRPAAWRHPSGGHRPDRAGHLHAGAGDLRRRGRAAGRAQGAGRGLLRQARRGRDRGHRDRAGPEREAPRGSREGGRCHHRALPGLSHRPAGADDGASCAPPTGSACWRRRSSRTASCTRPS